MNNNNDNNKIDLDREKWHMTLLHISSYLSITFIIIIKKEMIHMQLYLPDTHDFCKLFMIIM